MQIGGLEIVSSLNFGPEFIFPIIASAVSLFLLVMFLFYFKFSSSLNERKRTEIRILILLSVLIFVFNLLLLINLKLFSMGKIVFIVSGVQAIIIPFIMISIWLYLDTIIQTDKTTKPVVRITIALIASVLLILLYKYGWFDPYFIVLGLLLPVMISLIKMIGLYGKSSSHELIGHPFVYVSVVILIGSIVGQMVSSHTSMNWIFSSSLGLMLALLAFALILKAMRYNRVADRNREKFSVLYGSLQRLLDQLIQTSDEMVDNYQQLVKNSERSENSVANMSESFSKLIEVSNKARENSNIAVTVVDENVNVFQNISNVMLEQKDSIVAIDEYLKNLQVMVDNVNKNSNNMANAINRLTDNVENGKKLVSRNLNSMETIKNFIEQVYYIVDVIYDISDQINILAMNASIEAAHAGDRGKGFAVVAEEIRNVSVQTSVEANTIGENISQIIDQIDRGSEVVSQTSEIFNSFSKNIEKLFVYILKIIDTSKSLMTEIDNISGDMKILKNSAIGNSKKSESESRVNHELLRKMNLVKRYIDKTSQNVEKENERVQTIMEDVTNLIRFSRDSQNIIEKLNGLRSELQSYIN